MAAVRIIDVTPRDGLQDATGYVPVPDKVQLIQGLFGAGVQAIEVTAFVSPRWSPFIADGEEVLGQLRDHRGEWIALVPNVRGVQRAIRAGVDAVTLVVSASESHNRANLNRSRDETLNLLQDAARLARQQGLRIRGAVSTAFDCPFEGRVALSAVLEVVARYLAMGVDEIILADTLGTATPRLIKERVQAMKAVAPEKTVGLHLHDRRGWGLANVAVAYEYGVQEFEAALGGLGGCPYAPGSAVNLDLERLVEFFEAQGISTGIAGDRLVEVRQRVLSVIAQGLPAPETSKKMEG